MQETRVSVPGALGLVSGLGGKRGMNQLVYGQPSVKTLLLTLAGMRPRRLHPQRSVGWGLARGQSLAKVAGGITLLKWS